MSTTGHENEAINVQGLKASLQKFKNEHVDTGQHPDFVAGNVVGEFSDTGAEFAYRPTAGAVDIESGIADHGGHLEVIKGNTVAWNQLFSYNVNWNSNNGGSVSSISETSVTVNCEPQLLSGGYHRISYTTGHVFYAYFKINAVNNNRVRVGYEGSCQYIGDASNGATLNGLTTSPYAFIIYTDEDAANTITVSNSILIDLTLIYGAGNEPTTAAAFEADYQKWFGKPLTYEDYDAGSLRPVKMTGLKTVGFNVYDVSKETSDKVRQNCSVSLSGDYVTLNVINTDAFWGTFNDGQWQSFDGALYNILPSKQYYFQLSNSNFIKNYISFFDSSLTYISTVYITNNKQTFHTPSNCRYFTLRIGTGDVISSGTYTTQICINLSHSGDRDGEYEPHWESTLNVPITTLTGKLNGQGSSVVVFPDGMKKAGTVYDEIVKRGTQTIGIKRVGSVNMGELTYGINAVSQDTPYGGFYSLIDNAKQGTNIILAKYGNYELNYKKDNVCFVNGSVINIIDSSYNNDAAAFKTAMSNVMLFYELATPEEYLLDDFELPQSYDVDDWGTEEILLGENGCAPVLDLKYGINAGDTIKNLPHNYVSINRQNFSEGQQAIARQNIGAASQEDMIKVQKQIEALSKATESDLWVDMGLPSGILWAKRNIDLSQANGFAASEYQYEGSFFSWGNTDGHNPTTNNSFGEYSFGTGNDTEPYVSSDGAALTGDITPSFDAARVNLGAPWRMPTTDEYTELFNPAYTKFIDASGNDIAPSTTDKLITMNGVVGIRLKSIINGNIIFFPCGGYGTDTSLNSRGTHGYYWTSSLYSSTYCKNLYFDSLAIYPSDKVSRFLGLPIRPVM